MINRMQPNGLPPVPPPMTAKITAEHNPYDFITSPGHSGYGRGPSMKMRIIVVVVGAFVLLTGALVFYSILTSGSKENKAALLDAAKEQALVLQIAKTGVEKARSTQAKNLAVTTQVSIITQQQLLVTALKDANIGVDQKSLAATKNTQIEQVLTQADQRNQFDDVFIDTLTKQIGVYQKKMLEARQGVNNKKLQDAMALQVKNANLLTKQAE